METLDVNTVVPKLDQEQNPCLETLDCAPRFSSSSDKCAELVCDSGVCSKEGRGLVVGDVVNNEIGNVEVDGRVFPDWNFAEGGEGKILVGGEVGVIGSGNDSWNLEGIEASKLVSDVAAGNQRNLCSLELDSEGQTAKAPNNEMRNVHGFVQEVCSIGEGIDEVLMHEGIGEEDASQLDVVDAGNRIETSPAEISLYVDVFGKVDSAVQGVDSGLLEQGLFESSINEEYMWKENSAILPDYGNNESASEVQDCDIDMDAEQGNLVEGEVVADQGYMFNVDDLVWAKLNTQFWWPAMICKHLDASNDAVKMEKKERLQIRLFGSGDVLWGLSSQLKPFHEYFEQMSTQSNSKSFVCSVEKAVNEIGRRAKLEMTCSCYPEKSRITSVAEGGSKLSKENARKTDELPVLQFEPENLLARIKCFARDVVVPDMIESKVIQNRLSAFYCSIGHRQLPMHQLKASDAKSDDHNGVGSGLISSKPGFESRNRSSNKDPKDANDNGICTTISAMKMPSPDVSTKSTKNKAKSVEYVNRGTDRKAEKSYESRERRKSKYLSFPYVDPGQVAKSLTGLEENEVNCPVAVAVSRVRENKKTADDSSVVSAFKVKSHDKKSKNSWCGKQMGHNISIQDVINASSAEMLSKLQFTALDCQYPDESKPFIVWESFFSRFRTFAFRDFTHEDTVRKDSDNGTGLPNTLLEVEIQTEKLMEKESSGEHMSTVEALAAAPEVSKTAGIDSTGKDLNMKSRQKSRKKKEKALALGLNTTPTGSMSENVTTSGSIVIDFQKIDPPESGIQSVPKKRKRKATGTPGFPEIKVIAALPDLNGRSGGPQLEGFNVGNAVKPNKGKSELKRKKEATSVNHSMTNGVGENGSIRIVEGLKEVEVIGAYSLQNIPELNKERTKEPASLLLNAEIAPKQQDGSNNPEPISVAKQEGKKRKRKQKDTDVTSAIPDLNGNTSESRLEEACQPKEACQPEECTPAEGKPQRRRRKKKADAGLLDINLSAGEAQSNGEALGVALLLKFSPEAPMPTKEDLMSAFSKFGTLKDSETQVVNDCATAQVVFVDSSDARNAFRSLEKNSPFGPALVNYRLHVLFAAAGGSEPDGRMNLHEVWPADDVKKPPKRSNSKKPKEPVKPLIVTPPQHEGQEAPDLQFVRQNLQMMRSMLENAGDNVSPETRAQLELEIKSLLMKVSSMVGASSS